MNRLLRSRIKSIVNSTRAKSTSSQPKKTDFEHCISYVKDTDFNFYLSTLIMPKQIVRSAFAVRAFNIELLSIGRSRTSDPSSSTISQMKLKFWQDQLKKIYDAQKVDPEGKLRLKLFEPISNELAVAVQHHKLSKSWLNRLIDGRRQFFSSTQFRTLDELEKCADASMATVYYILLQCMNVKSIDCDHAASHLGKVEMLTGIARNILKQSSQVVFYLPMELLTKHGIAQQDLINFSARVLKPKQNNIKDLTFEICSRANQHLKSARSLNDKIPKECKTIFSSAMHLEVILKNMEKYDFDLMDKRLLNDFRLGIIYKTILARLKNVY